MAFPSDVGFQLSGFSASDSSVVQRSDMEKGPAKTRRDTTDPVTTISAKLRFRTWAIQDAFDDWFYSPAGANGGAAWFDWTDPRNGVLREARIVKLGELTPLSASHGFSERPVDLEYVRRLAA